MYFNAVQKYTAGSKTKVGIDKLTKLIHLREDVGFAGITEFHCRAILGACWDPKAAQYSATYKIPQCYEEKHIEGSDGSLQLYDPKLFKPVVPQQFQAVEGECDTNYFHISTLYYKRRACTYSIDMIKYGHEFNPLNEPSRQDCLFRLGCCYEDNDEVMQQYPFMPRCYHRVKNEVIDTRLHDMKLVYKQSSWHKDPSTYSSERVCGATEIVRYITTSKTAGSLPGLGLTWTTLKTNFEAGNAATIAGQENLADKHVTLTGTSLTSAKADISAANLCLYKRKDFYTVPTNANFWQAYDIFDKQYVIKTQVPEGNIPESLRGLMQDLF